MNISVLKSKWLVRFFLMLSIISIAWLLQINACLKTEITPNGILSFQALTNKADADSTTIAWEKKICANGVPATTLAKRSYIVDTVFFIPSYGLLIFLLLIRWNTNAKLKFDRWYKPWLLAIAIVLDLTENYLSYSFLEHRFKWSALFTWISLLKITFFIAALFSVRLIATIFKYSFAQLSSYVKILFEVIWNFRVIVVELLALYLVLWQSDQGQDLLINLNESRAGFTVFFVTITVLAFLNWHLPKYLSYNTTLPRPRNIRHWLRVIFDGSVFYRASASTGNVRFVEDSDLGRLFGMLTFLIPAFGMLNVMEKYKIGVYYPNWCLLISIVLILLILRFNLIDNAYLKHIKLRWVFHALLLICVILLGFFFWRNNGLPKDLIFVCFSLVTLAIMFLIFTSIRRNFSLRVAAIKIAPLVMWPSVFLAILFIAVNVRPLYLAKIESEWVQYSTISIFLFALFAYLLLFSFLIFWGRSTRINIAGFFLLASLITAIFVHNRFHDVTLCDQLSVQPPPLKDYTKLWLLDRSDAIKYYDSVNQRKYPVVIVSNYGGGIRAAAWTSLVIVDLDNLVWNESQKREKFQDHVFAYTGASGGTIGASVMCALQRQNPAREISLESMISFYKSDFLSPVVVGLIGRDFIFSVFGINGRDRAKLQEEIWEYHMSKHFDNDIYGKSLSHCWNGESYKTPLLFSNSTQVETGLKGIVAPVALDARDFPASVKINELLKNDIKVSTAAFFSARFPFISPAGRVIRNTHFLDGGIYENSGGETAAEVSNVLKHVLDEDSSLTNLKDKVEIIVLSLKNSPPNAPEIKEKNLFELSAPLNALVANVDGAAITADKKNEEDFGPNYFKLYPDSIPAKSDALKAVLPLGWQLSAQALTRLKNSLDNPTKAELLKRFRPKINGQ